MSRRHDGGTTDEVKTWCDVGAWQLGCSLGHDMDSGVGDGAQGGRNAETAQDACAWEKA